MENLNTVNDVQEGNVDLQNENATAAIEPEESEGAENLNPDTSGDEGQDSYGGDGDRQREHEGRDFERDHMFAEVRRNAENAGRQRALEEMAPLIDALDGMDIRGSYQDRADIINAQNQGVSLDEYRASRREENERIENHPMVQGLRNELESVRSELAAAEFEKYKAEDLKIIKKAFPDCDLKSIDELGPDFISMRAAKASPEAAYAACMAVKKAYEPPKVGKTGSATGGEKDFFTFEEAQDIAKNHKEMLEDPKVLAKLNKSRERW